MTQAKPNRSNCDPATLAVWSLLAMVLVAIVIGECRKLPETAGRGA